MIQFTKIHKGVDLGLIPSFLSEDDARPAAEQINDRYSFGGGWFPLPGFAMNDDESLQYPEDPPLRMLAFASLRDEKIRFYEHEWVAIIQPDGSFEASRID